MAKAKAITGRRGNGAGRGAAAEPILRRATTAEISRLLGTTPRRVRQLVAAGAIPRVARNCFDPVEVVHALVRHYQRIAEGRGDDTERAHRIRRLKAEADLWEMRAAETYLSQIPRAQIERSTAQLVEAWASAMRSAGTLAVRAHAAVTVEEIRFILEEWAYEQLDMLANRPVVYTDPDDEP